MAETITVRVPDDVGATLDRIERATDRDRASLVEEALTDYANREAAIVRGIERGLDDMREGRVVPHEGAMKRLRATIERVAAPSGAEGE